MQPADKIVTPATERIHVAAPRTRHLARIPEFKKYAPPDPSASDQSRRSILVT